MTTYSILIVEDEAIPAHYLKRHLEQAGHQVIGLATDASSTLHAFAQERSIDLVVMDIKLKGEIDGISLAKKLQQTAPVAILFTTAYADEAFLERAKAINTIGYLVKPIQPTTLLSTIEIGMSKFQPHTHTAHLHLCGESYFDTQEQLIQTDTHTVTLSNQEALLLKSFLDQPNLLFSKALLESILESFSPLGAGALRTTLWRLRKKLPPCLQIENIYNLGYKLKFLS